MISNEYTYRVTYNEEKREWIAICLEFPKIQGISPSSSGLAFYSLYEAISGLIENMYSNHGSVRILINNEEEEKVWALR